MGLLAVIAREHKVPIKMLLEAVSLSRKQVLHIPIKKKDGSQRKAYHPSKKTKLIQYWLIHNVLSKLPVHSSAMAYAEGASIKKNAEFHLQSRYFLKMDFKSFFHSIVFDDLIEPLSEWFQQEKPGWPFDDEAREIIRQTCFYTGDRLPIGYPASPVIANAVMFKFDNAVVGLLQDREPLIGNVLYTRYADDLIFSTNLSGTCRQVKEEMETLVSGWQSPRLTFNQEKTRFMSRSGGSAIVTGLRICYDSHITLHRKYKDKVRLLCSLLNKDSLAEEDKVKLLGHLSYIEHVDPAFYTRLMNKYFEALSQIKTENNPKRSH